MTDQVQAFFSAWTMEDAGLRRATIDAALAAGASYADPRTPEPITDAAALSDYVGQFIAAAPGAAVEVVKSDSRQGVTRATIAFRMAGGIEQTGQYFIETDGSGRITRMIGFVGTGDAG